MVRVLCAWAFCLMLLPASNVLAQGESKAKKLLEEARGHMAREDFLAADKKFREILSLNEVIPTDALYFFALTLERNHQLQSSRNFLNKYIEVTGKSGDYYNEALMLHRKLDIQAKEIDACELCDGDGFRLIACRLCDGQGKFDHKCSQCHGFGQITCSKCLGEGVQISKNSFGDNVYKTCEVCNGIGKEVCPQCHGVRHFVQDCPRCEGTGSSGSDVRCDHKKDFIVPSLNRIDN